MSLRGAGKRPITTRWSNILEQCNKFVGCFAIVKSKLGSGEAEGPNEAELVRRAKELFARKADSRGKKSRFLFLHAWEILRTVPKWADLRGQQAGATKKKRMKLDDNDNIVSDNEEPRRPMGVKAAKKLKFQGVQGTGERMSHKALAEAQLMRARAMLLQAELSLMTIPMAGLSDTARDYILLKQASVLANQKRISGEKGALDDELDENAIDNEFPAEEELV
ncbi:hypothetical protein B5M09_012280 [Aphanomyces astaci]|uniref:No apical meristem-associated C-terminal domain-containing protein n=1 Tax=Aphanomyces astaci TaxID=112090 RepID=A0A425CWN5_APHAT|nr:hypothetical protein B5M09_012280 [Aphanomyces astaci]